MYPINDPHIDNYSIHGASGERDWLRWYTQQILERPTWSTNLAERPFQWKRGAAGPRAGRMQRSWQVGELVTRLAPADVSVANGYNQWPVLCSWSRGLTHRLPRYIASCFVKAAPCWNKIQQTLYKEQSCHVSSPCYLQQHVHQLFFFQLGVFQVAARQKSHIYHAGIYLKGKNVTIC